MRVSRSGDHNLNRLKDRRFSARRRDVNLTTLVALTSGQDLCVRVLNIGATGLMFESAATHEVGQALTIELPGDIARTMHVRWNSGAFYGCQFDRPVPRSVIDSPLLIGTAGEGPEGERRLAGVSPEGTGYRIARLRKLRGWNQADLAGMLGVSKTTVCNWEREKCSPGADMTARLWLTLGEPEPALIGDDLAEEDLPQDRHGAEEHLGEVIQRCKIELAQAAGISTDQVQITLLV